MRIEIRLRQVLRDHKLEGPRVINRIVKGTGEHRTTITKLMNNQFKNPSLSTLGNVCHWLHEEGVPAELLPGCLFAIPPSKLWAACANKTRIALYLGEYNQVNLPRSRFWVAKRDSAAANQVSRILIESHNPSRAAPVIVEEYVPFRFIAQGETETLKDEPALQEDDPAFLEDVANSKKMLDDLKRPEQASILIGSMRVNYLVEQFMADLFKCEPFQADTSGHKIPIYMMHRDGDVNAPSCFGGPDPPAGYEGDPHPGIYYRRADGQWKMQPSMYKEQDVGVAVTAYNPGDGSIVIAIFGYSGRATFGMKRYLRDQADKLWPPKAVGPKGRRVGIYIFKMTFEEELTGGDSRTSNTEESVEGSKTAKAGKPAKRKQAVKVEQSENVKHCKIMALDNRVLEDALY